MITEFSQAAASVKHLKREVARRLDLLVSRRVNKSADCRGRIAAHLARHDLQSSGQEVQKCKLPCDLRRLGHGHLLVRRRKRLLDLQLN